MDSGVTPLHLKGGNLLAKVVHIHNNTLYMYPLDSLPMGVHSKRTRILLLEIFFTQVFLVGSI